MKTTAEKFRNLWNSYLRAVNQDSVPESFQHTVALLPDELRGLLVDMAAMVKVIRSSGHLYPCPHFRFAPEDRPANCKCDCGVDEFLGSLGEIVDTFDLGNRRDS